MKKTIHSKEYDRLISWLIAARKRKGLSQRALAKKLEREVVVWSTVFVCSIVAPFLYVLFFGKHLPWWVYGIIALLIGQGIFALIRKRGGPKNPTPLMP